MKDLSLFLKAEKLFIVTRHRSYIGLPKDIKDTCFALGLRHTHHTSLLIPSPYVVGNLAKLKNLIKLEYVDNGPFPLETLKYWVQGRGFRAPLGYYIESKGPFHFNRFNKTIRS